MYVAFFLYEDREARLQNRLEDLWVRVDDLQHSALSREAAFLQEATRVTGAALDRLLGPKLLSLRSVAICLALSQASEAIGIILAFPPGRQLLAGNVLVALLLVIAGCLPAIPSLNKSDNGHLRVILHSNSYSMGIIMLVVWTVWLSEASTPFSVLEMVAWHVFELVSGVALDIAFVIFFQVGTQKDH